MELLEQTVGLAVDIIMVYIGVYSAVAYSASFRPRIVLQEERKVKKRRVAESQSPASFQASQRKNRR